jgi:hypothetical protein
MNAKNIDNQLKINDFSYQQDVFNKYWDYS